MPQESEDPSVGRYSKLHRVKSFFVPRIWSFPKNGSNWWIDVHLYIFIYYTYLYSLYGYIYTIYRLYRLYGKSVVLGLKKSITNSGGDSAWGSVLHWEMLEVEVEVLHWRSHWQVSSTIVSRMILDGTSQMVWSWHGFPWVHRDLESWPISQIRKKWQILGWWI